MSEAAMVLCIVGIVAFMLSIAEICDSLVKIAEAKYGKHPGQNEEVIKAMIREMQDQKLNDGSVYSGSLDEGIDVAISIVETYGKDLK